MAEFESKTPLEVGEARVEVPDYFKTLFRACMNDPLLFIPKPFETWMVDRVAVSGLNLPIGQIIGFSQFTVQSDFIETNESTTSLPYTDLATVGPTLTGIPDGQYILGFGAQTGVVTDSASMSVSVNGAAASDADSATMGTSGAIGGNIVRFISSTMSTGGNNTVTAKYKTNNGTTIPFMRRWLIALKYANA